MNTYPHAAVCTTHGLIRWVSSCAAAKAAAEQHHTLTGCYAYVQIQSTRAAL